MFLLPLCSHEQSRLEKIVCVNVCQTIVDEVLQGIHTPERPSSPAEIYVTEEQEFLKKNPKVRGKQRQVYCASLRLNFFFFNYYY